MCILALKQGICAYNALYASFLIKTREVSIQSINYLLLLHRTPLYTNVTTY
jgi:hypothetical protein